MSEQQVPPVVIWVEIPTTDIQQAATFYKAILQTDTPTVESDGGGVRQIMTLHNSNGIQSGLSLTQT